jgi:hypothetical protein
LLEGFRAGSNRFEHGAFADLVAQAGRLQILDDRLFFGFSFQLVDGAPLEKKISFIVSLTQRGGAATKDEQTFQHESPNAAKPQPKKEEGFHHEGHEEHEG